MTDLEEAATGAALIAAERRRQIDQEGWTPEHDAEHDTDALTEAAICYATAPDKRPRRLEHPPARWPWDDTYWKPTPDDRVRELVKAGALIAAEIDRVRAAYPPALSPQGQETALDRQHRVASRRLSQIPEAYR